MIKLGCMFKLEWATDGQIYMDEYIYYNIFETLTRMYMPIGLNESFSKI